MTATPITVLRDRTPQPAGLVWEEPPTRTRPGKYAPIAAALRENPGRWAVLRTYPTTQGKRAWGFATAIRQGKFADLRQGFEACARTVDDQVRVYIRYTGEDVDR